MSWISEAAGGREFNIDQYAMPDVRVSMQICGTHWREVSTGWSYPAHNHALFELNYVLEGQQLMTIDNRRYVQQSGELLMLAPDCLHESRIGRCPSMSYFCLHFDIEDEVMYRRIAALGSQLFDASAELTIKLKPELERLAALCREQTEDAVEGIEIRISILRLILELSEYCVSLATQEQQITATKRQQTESAQGLRERYALEKKIQDFLGHAESMGAWNERTLLPPFHWVGLFTIGVPDRSFWTKPDRFLAKTLLEDALSEWATPAVVVGKQRLTAVLFIEGYSVPPLEEYASDCRSRLKRKLNQNITLGIGGVAVSPNELQGLYRQSLRGLGLNEELGSMPDFEFTNRTIRLALLAIESEYADSLTLSQLASRLQLTPNYLSGLFTSETGHSFTWHLTRIRMDRACELLANTQIKIHEVARQVGYSDQAYFSRCFKSMIGMSPNSYRTKRLEY
ncbi:AraC family transcriptional regulator [Saccharibacillus sp. JS10]|uniref:AraC family transcriptional regulator n=1 Tax=Saccharibacillus sp. JS10 TaxID=2950552 RepID=UPI00210989BC|nr:AraC family transcriptional regulator [Saccharibacillus sp. JS10]MCQ4085385.1 AraC family transcriptional regulator [Saccharibacillus sp. JS10]